MAAIFAADWGESEALVQLPVPWAVLNFRLQFMSRPRLLFADRDCNECDNCKKQVLEP